ncbi:hypothetical protein SELMODRAFT_145745 [Selaginella moellendorffii]|uniref:CTLH domain-containing protein n=1 Tax=Selaginella moellendorffii TaxID=88036 RepID=D8RDI8_SELML|nr:glucose-induced degradation protein 8 homolog [Selaginella moellendorffii]XP_024529534.1 glucose-induced degradation protein 8 homolog isoform X4 [Selaginella moellendorffii]EFJ08976.1 hypothetical protein SELMODRAFT_160466 [Selaginella moellendorffii]EFJ30031.1 hypothetical protein SELMODRAFT_145745 [Selaginella moellendorffii]|eukprot:XP_002989963.1 glucose-induced degradation protein 8 homolog [Selaginella moellendorffii]
MDVENVKVDDNDVKKVLLGYLVHNCFKETAEAFIASTEMNCSADFSMDIDRRKPIYNHVMGGEPLKAIDLTNGVAPGLLLDNKDLHFDLLTLHFIELVRSRNAIGALEFAQRELTPFGKEKHYVDKLQDCMALLAYSEPETSPLFSLLSVDYRQNIADMLNRALLDHGKLPSYTSMERLLQQFTLVSQRLQQEQGGKDLHASFTLRTFLA